MLTVKHITPSGEEFVYGTAHVNFVPATAKPATASDTKADTNDSLWIYEPIEGSRARELIGGTAFVMNDNGSTVARYDLGASMMPVGGPIGVGRGVFPKPPVG
jgi:hypothetical protein